MSLDQQVEQLKASIKSDFDNTKAEFQKDFDAIKAGYKDRIKTETRELREQTERDLQLLKSRFIAIAGGVLAAILLGVVTSLYTATKEVNEARRASGAEVIELQKDVNSAQKDINSAQTLIQETKDKLNKAIAGGEEAILGSRKELDSARSAVSQARSEVDASRRDLVDTKSAYDQRMNELAVLKTSLVRTREENTQLIEDRLKTITTQFDARLRTIAQRLEDFAAVTPRQPSPAPTP
jgi:DNA repair exonuclease SbcCD ATPase subunit